MNRQPSALALLLITGLFLGATFPLTGLAMRAGVPPATWAALTSGGGALALAAYMALRREHLTFDGPNLRFYLFGGLLSYVFPNLLVFTLIPHLGAGLTSITYTLSPIVTLVLSTLLRVRRTNLLGLIGILVGLAGALMIVFGKGQVNKPAEPLWLAVAALVPLTLASGNVYRTMAWPKGAGGVPLAVGCNIAAALILLLVVAFGPGIASVSTLANAGWEAVGQAVTTALMLLFFFRLQLAGGPVYLSQVGYVAAAIGLAAGTLLLGETYGFWTWSGAAVIALGVVMTTLAQRTG